MRRSVLAASVILTSYQNVTAQTFNYVYTGNKLTKSPYYRRIPDVRQLSLTVSSPTELPANACTNLPQTALTALSDGRDTLASLAAAGFTLAGSSISLCTDAEGKSVTSWVLDLGFTGSSEHHNKNTVYTAYTDSVMTQGRPWFDSVGLEHGLGYKTKFRFDWNTTATGTWQIQRGDK
jgi:hypothetical protein